MQVMLEQILDALCVPIKATYGLIFTFENGTTQQLAQYRWKSDAVILPSSLFAADDFLYLTPGHFPAPLQDAVLLVPLYIDMEQVGALVLGRPMNGVQYTPEDVEQLLYPADQIAESLILHRQNVEHLEKLEQVANASPAVRTAKISIPVEAVDYVLRNISNYTYLADSPLANLTIVRKKLTGDKTTYIERGKAVQAIVLEALKLLMPSPEIPPEPLPREWYPYVILHDAYVEEVQNREIMGRLYISEGTYNRTRRTALSSLARVLAEIEHSA